MAWLWLSVILTAGPTEPLPLPTLVIHLTADRLTVGGELEVELRNVTSHPLTTWGFGETPGGGPDVSPSVSFHFARVVDGARAGTVLVRESMLPPIDDLYGRAYELKPGASWRQKFTQWAPFAGLPPGAYELWAEFNDAPLVSAGIVRTSAAVGRVVSAVVRVTITPAPAPSKPTPTPNGTR